ncbi:peptide/nickel transport system substrate-binding protein [Nocardia tenerifensis]|uniref:Peptide/nickel transport system substrate-binding protein n=1 Tax=Nocardia tenerifensis TaxID=228006 RepID=A0A318K461_9NOCA|nr:ABC transporter substrate-binding protein [Nocardia tenerifensis]PXX63910.1 peptide/nickel transport system substrate-binding protein [Nocardia tenerifensis]
MTSRSGKIDYARLDEFRWGRGPVEEQVIDEFIAGRLTRRGFLRQGSMLGLSMPLLGGILAACGATTGSSGPPPSGKPGATIKAGIYAPKAAPNPITIVDPGGIQLLGNVGEYLVLADQDNNYRPWLATSWSSNADASVWTFQIRQGVRFNDGTPMTVDDVVYSFQSQCDPKSSANALSLFAGTLSPGGVRKVDDSTVAFDLDAPDGGFVGTVSSDNYNMIIVPKDYDYGSYSADFIGTGRLMKADYVPNVGATYVPNPHYWGTPALPSRVDFIFYAEETPMVADLQAGAIDCIGQFSAVISPQLLNGSFTVTSLKAASHRQLSLRNDVGPFQNKLVRQALACTLDRPAIVSALFKGQAVVGNESPFAPTFASTNPDVPQRNKDLALARQLLAQAGVARGFSTTLLTEKLHEIPHFAQIIKQSAAQIGVDIKLIIETPSKYYGQATFGKSDWLDGEMSLVDYGARVIPNVYLKAPLQSIDTESRQGSWNAAHFRNPAYDKLSKEFVAAVDLSTQRRLAGQIQRLLLDETPVVFAYFYNYLSATQRSVTGVYPTAGLQFFLGNAAKG